MKTVNIIFLEKINWIEKICKFMKRKYKNKI